MQWICLIEPGRLYFIHALLCKIRCYISPRQINCKMVSLHRLTEWNRHFYPSQNEISLLCLSPLSTGTATVSVSIGRENRVPRDKLCYHLVCFSMPVLKCLPKTIWRESFLVVIVCFFSCLFLFFSPSTLQVTIHHGEKSGQELKTETQSQKQQSWRTASWLVLPVFLSFLFYTAQRHLSGDRGGTVHSALGPPIANIK